MHIPKMVFFILVMAELASAQQVEVSRSVLTNGGNTMGDQNYRISSTVGQTVIGKMRGTETVISSGFWYSDIHITTDLEATTKQVPQRFQLNQNYPNPFNPGTTISFSIAKTARVKLVLYDLLGRKVLTLRDERMQPGEYKLILDATALASGVYFYRLLATDIDNNSHIFTRKLTLIK